MSNSKYLHWCMVRTSQREPWQGETAEVSYQLPAVARGATNCHVCERKFITHHCLMKHMGVHRSEKFTCNRCSKVLASRKMLKFHQSSCVRGKTSLLPCLCQTIWVKAGDATAPQGGPWCRLTWDGWDLFLFILQQKFQCKEEHAGALQHLCLQSGQKRAFLLLCHWVSKGWPSLQQDEEPQLSLVWGAWLGITKSIKSLTKVTGCFDSFDGHLSIESVLCIVHLVVSYFLMCIFAGCLGGCPGGCFVILNVFCWLLGWLLCYNLSVILVFKKEIKKS